MPERFRPAYRQAALKLFLAAYFRLGLDFCNWKKDAYNGPKRF
jgi:hypothetical protein